MKLFRMTVLAAVATAVLMLAGCAQATDDKKDPDTTKPAGTLPLTFESGSVEGITVTQPLVNGVQNNFTAATLDVAIADDQADVNHAIRSIGADGNQGDPLTGNAWDAGGFDNGTKSLKFDYGVSVDSGRVAVNFDPVISGSLTDKTAFNFSVKIPDAAGGIGTNILLTGSDAKVYSSTAIDGDGSWTYAVMDKVWVTFQVALSTFKAADGTTLATAAAAGTTVTKAQLYFRIDSGAMGVSKDTEYHAYLDNIGFY